MLQAVPDMMLLRAQDGLLSLGQKLDSSCALAPKVLCFVAAGRRECSFPRSSQQQSNRC